VPPERIPNEDVATHLVEVPVVCRIIPRVPDAFVESRKVPVRLILPVVRLVADAVVRVV
jgi:hypothetical protein